MILSRNSVLRALLLLIPLVLTVAALAQTSSPLVSYTSTLASPQQHLIEVQISLPAGSAHRELQLPVWNALYQIRDFSQFVNWIDAKDRTGKPLQVHAMNSSRWELNGAENGAVVEYQIYVDSQGPFGAQLNLHHAFLNLAQVLMYPVDDRNSPFAVRFTHLPKEWQVATPLELKEGAYTAENYDRLVDSPVEISSFHESDFDESGAHFRVVFDADAADYNSDKIVADLRKIVSAAISWMNDRPFERYTFFYHFPHGPSGGGMEHAYSTAIEISAESIKRNLNPLYAVSAHEFFHLWNVKRIRPQTLEPIDYTKENYTRALWFSEGVTSTVENIIQLRAGVIDEKQYLHNLAEQITELQRRPARLTQSAETSSIDAWLEGNSYYRRPERSISYYNKGELLGTVLDLAVRDVSRGQASLRDVLRWMNENYARKRKFFDDSNGVREAAEAVSRGNLADFFSQYVAGTEEIPWDDFLRYVGLRIEQGVTSVPDPGFLASRNFDGPMTVVAITPNSDAERAGLQVGDTILELQGKPAGQESRQELSRMSPGDTLMVKVRGRRGGERELKWNVGARNEISYDVTDVDQVTPEQRAHRAAWLRGEAENTGGTPGQ